MIEVFINYAVAVCAIFIVCAILGKVIGDLFDEIFK